jgi:ATP-dependent Clp protease ATP-binding subunit ClpC
VGEPSPAAARRILEGLAPAYGDHHGVTFSSDALDAAVRLSVRYINDRFLPDKAIDVLDEAGAWVQLRSYHDAGDTSPVVEVTEADVAEVVSRWSGVPLTALSRTEADALLTLEGTLSARVVGQVPAVRAVARAVRRARAGLAPTGRPVAALLFAGPTGVGKTELVKALAETYFGTQSSLVRLDMSEYMEAFSVSRLTGPPPGYIGFEQGGQLTEAVRRQPYCCVLMDEMEKAHPDVANILLQVLEDGRLTDGKGRVVDFSNCLLVMTSNVGAQAIVDALAASSSDAQDDADDAEGAASSGGDDDANAIAQVAVAVRSELSDKYRPEFLNRLDEIVIFRPLAREALHQVVDLLLQRVSASAEPLGVSVSATPALRARLEREGASARFGARPLRRAVRRLVEDPLAEALLEGFASKGDAITVDDDDDDDGEPGHATAAGSVPLILGFGEASVLLRRARDGATRRCRVEAAALGIEAGDSKGARATADDVAKALSPQVQAMRQ